MPEKFYIVDGTALVYRSFFAFIRNPLVNKKGEDTSASFGFAAGMLRLIREEKPDYLVVTFDRKEPTFRHEMYAEYKATRERMPDELAAQLPRIDQITNALNIETLAIPGYEADDIIGTLAKIGEKADMEVTVVTGDKDLMQLVNKNVRWMNLRKSSEKPEVLNAKGVKEKFDVLPEQVIDKLALMGDASDNVPGVAGIGKVTAAKLINEFGSLEKVYENLENVPQKGVREKLANDRENAFLSKKLVTIDCAVPLENSEIKTFVLRQPDEEKTRELFKELEFTSLLGNMPKVRQKVVLERNYHTAETLKDVHKIAKAISKTDFVFDLESTGLDTITAEIVGFSFSWEESVAWYVPVTAPDIIVPYSIYDVLEIFKPIFENEKIGKVAQNIKYDASLLLSYDIHVRGIKFDTMIAAHLINPDNRAVGLDALSEENLYVTKIPTKELIGTGQKEITMDKVPLEQIAEYACEDADHTFRLWKIFEPMIEEKELTRIFNDLELPLIDVLIDMERAGVSLDLDFLKQMSGDMHKKMDMIIDEIYKGAGEEFMINSPQQLGKILFEKLEIHKDFGMTRVKKTKTGYSTDVSTLEKFQTHPLVSNVLDYRKYAKLLSTYIDALPELVNEKTHRVHSSFNQTIAATGRLSSTNPNMQNIPIRRSEGREIRRAFIPGDGDKVLISADYSQIELRIMAHLSGDEALREAFLSGQDIHTSTASKIFQTPIEEVLPEMRYQAKAINFGIMYGMSQYRLAREINISNEEAQDFIMTYFSTFPGVNSYIANQLAKARELGYVTTMFGRKRYIPELHSDNQRVRQNAENIAINTPIQGTAAELIKLAMIKLRKRFAEENCTAKLLLQIHDELVLEADAAQKETVLTIVKETMENTLELSVPLTVEIMAGANWFEAH